MNLEEFEQQCNLLGLKVAIWRHSESYMKPDCWTVTLETSREDTKIEISKRGPTLSSASSQAYSALQKLCCGGEVQKFLIPTIERKAEPPPHETPTPHPSVVGVGDIDDDDYPPF